MCHITQNSVRVYQKDRQFTLLKHTDELCGQHAVIFNAVAYGVYTYHRALIDEVFLKVGQLFTVMLVTLNGSHFNVKFVVY
jgi:hypothetical protein